MLLAHLLNRLLHRHGPQLPLRGRVGRASAVQEPAADAAAAPGEPACAALVALAIDEDPECEGLEPVSDQDACANATARLGKWRRHALIVDMRVVRHVLLSATLWSNVPLREE